MKTLQENSGHFCEECLALRDEKVPAYKLVESLLDRHHMIPLCEECYENWCIDTELLMEDYEEDDF